MGYRIDYQSVAKTGKPAKRHHPILLVSFCLLAAVLFNTVFRDQRAFLLRIIFPGDAAVAMASLENMLAQLKAGVPFAGALQAFCQQVIAG